MERKSKKKLFHCWVYGFDYNFQYYLRLIIRKKIGKRPWSISAACEHAPISVRKHVSVLKGFSHSIYHFNLDLSSYSQIVLLIVSSLSGWGVSGPGYIQTLNSNRRKSITPFRIYPVAIGISIYFNCTNFSSLTAQKCVTNWDWLTWWLWRCVRW